MKLDGKAFSLKVSEFKKPAKRQREKKHKIVDEEGFEFPKNPAKVMKTSPRSDKYLFIPS